MSAFLSDVTLVVSECVEWIGQYLDVILDNPALTVMCVAIPIVSVSVDLLRRLIRI